METQAYFSGIREKIIEHLGTAKESVLVAVAWLTDRELFDALVACQRRGVSMSLAVLDDRINRKSSITWVRLTALGSMHYRYLHWVKHAMSLSLCARLMIGLGREEIPVR